MKHRILRIVDDITYWAPLVFSISIAALIAASIAPGVNEEAAITYLIAGIGSTYIAIFCYVAVHVQNKIASYEAAQQTSDTE